jgi:PP-loop superfamily ATP-utilizing enzyme
MARRISDAITPLGFRWVALDLDGYRSGSLNEVLPEGAAPSDEIAM